MKKNVGTFDALMRITCGLTGVAWGTAKMVKHPFRSFPLVVTFAAAMKVAEGVTRFCPMLAMLNMSSERFLEPANEPRIQTHDQELNPKQTGDVERREG